MKLTLKRGNNVLAMTSIVGGIIIIALAIYQGLPFMKKELPGSGFFPILCGVAIIGCGLLILVENKYKAKKALEEGLEESELDEDLINRVELRNFAYTIGISIFVLIMTPFIGILLSIGISIVAMIKILGRESITKALLIGVVTTFILFMIFSVFLGVPLPSSYIGI